MVRLFQIIFVLFTLTVAAHVAVDIFYSVVSDRLRPDFRTEAVEQTSSDVKEDDRPLIDQFRRISEKNIFGIAAQEEREGPGNEEIEALEPTSLNVVLLGTGAFTNNPEEAVAVIQEPGRREQQYFRVGDSIQGALIKSILRGKVVVSVGGRDEILTMDRESSPSTPSRGASRLVGAAVGGSGLTIRRSEIEGSLRNVNRLLSEVRIRPHVYQGRTEGLSLTRITQGSLFERLGFQDGDVLQQIDSSPVKGPGDILALYRKLRSQPRISVTVNRRGRSMTMNYLFE